MAVATAPPTAMCGSEARLCSASPCSSSAGASSPYVIPALNETVPRSTTTSCGSAVSETSASDSPMPLNECRVPSTRIRGAAATISRSSSMVCGRMRTLTACEVPG